MSESASWRLMFPIQPPARIDRIKWRLTCCTTPTYLEETHIITKDFQHLQTDGASMGLIYDIVVDGLDSKPVSSFFIQWHIFVPNPVGDTTDDWESYEDICSKSELVARRWAIQSENKITIHNFHDGKCMYMNVYPSDLQIVELDCRMLEYWRSAETIRQAEIYSQYNRSIAVDDSSDEESVLSSNEYSEREG